MKQTFFWAICITLCIVSSSCAINKQEAKDERQLCGGYTKYRALSDDEEKLFRDTYKGDLVLEPFEVATQVVAGTNYRFKCREGKQDIYLVEIFQPLPGRGDAELVSVTKL